MTDFWAGRRVLVTGHTGFKGAWLSSWLVQKGAGVFGLALVPDTTPALFDQLALAARVDHMICDIRDRDAVAARVRAIRPDVILHLAAQPIVRRSYREPVETFATNVMGTVHLLEALRGWDQPCAVVIVTTDKVYDNHEWVHAYRETDPLGGHDPYSASKAACEVAVDSYRKSFFKDAPVRIASARAGNVIGGGDWSEDRIIPDLVRANSRGRALTVRNAHAIRPWQHVLDPLNGYLVLAEALYLGRANVADSFNFGPDPAGQRTVQDLVESAYSHWAGRWENLTDPAAPHEAGCLALATEKARMVLGWTPRWGFGESVAETIAWYRAVHEGQDPIAVTRQQIAAFDEAGT